MSEHDTLVRKILASLTPEELALLRPEAPAVQPQAAPATADLSAAERVAATIADPAAQTVYLTLCALSVENQTTGYMDRRTGRQRTTPAIAGWRIMAETRGMDYGKPFSELMAGLVADGHVKHAGRSYIPTIYDSGMVRGARSDRGDRSSAIARQVQELQSRLAERASKPTARTIRRHKVA